MFEVLYICFLHITNFAMDGRYSGIKEIIKSMCFSYAIQFTLSTTLNLRLTCQIEYTLISYAWLGIQIVF